jgi:AAHS family 4-hydroxybenzoate transporter-like MFS transporter
MDTRAKVNVSDLVDNSKIGAFQVGIFILCGLSLIMDGFDVQALGYVAPALFADFHMANAAGQVASFTLSGVLFGSLLFSMLADRIGRRPVLIGCTLYYAVLTLLTSQASSFNQLLIIRFIAGFGMGGIMPNAMALVGEYSPRKVRVTAMMIVANGFTAGAAIGGFVAAYLIPNFGWRSVFYFGGAIPLVVALLMVLRVPESLQFLVLHGKDPGVISKWLRRIDPTIPASGIGTQYIVNEEKQRGVPIVQLFHGGRAVGTILLWVVNFMNLLNLYFLSTWLPTVAKEAGYSTSGSVLVGTMFQVGGTIGALCLGWFIHRFDFVPVLTACFVAASLSIAGTGQPALSPVLLVLTVVMAGFGIVGGQSGVNALAATYYPTDLRSTGIGAGLGVGRIGSIIGPVLGEFMRQQWTTSALFVAAAVPAMISAFVMFSMRWTAKPQIAVGTETPKVLAH